MSTTPNTPQPTPEYHGASKKTRSLLSGVHYNWDAAKRLATQLGLPTFTVQRAALRAGRLMDEELKASRAGGASVAQDGQ